METPKLTRRNISVLNFPVYLFIISVLMSVLGCQEIDTIKKELKLKLETKLLKKKLSSFKKRGSR